VHLRELAASLEARGVTLTVAYNEHLHDRECIFDNGYVVKIGRGLDYFKPVVGGRFVLGAHDHNLRQCKATKVDVFFDPSRRTV